LIPVAQALHSASVFVHSSRSFHRRMSAYAGLSTHGFEGISMLVEDDSQINSSVELDSGNLNESVDSTSEEEDGANIIEQTLADLASACTSCPSADRLTNIFETFIAGLPSCAEDAVIRFDKCVLINSSKAVKAAVGKEVWTKDIAHLFGSSLKALQSAQQHVVAIREGPQVGTLVEAFWSNRSWCCAEVERVNTPNGTVTYDVRYLDTSQEQCVNREKIRPLSSKSQTLAEAVRNNEPSLLLQYMGWYMDDLDALRVGCGLLALLVYSPRWRQAVGDGYKKPLLEMGAGRTLLSAIESAQTASPMVQPDDRTGNTGSKMIDKALRALYNFTFHSDKTHEEWLIENLNIDRADEIIASAVRTHGPYNEDVKNWGIRTLSRMVGQDRMQELGLAAR
jgi:hypothetical protein